MIHTRNGSTLSIMDMFRALGFIVLALFISSALLLSLALLFFGSSLTQDPLQTCRVALRPVACESKAMTHR